MSGIEVNADVLSIFNDMKLRQIHKYATFKIVGKKTVQVDSKGEPEKTEDKDADKRRFDELKGLLGKEPRYILYDFGFTNSEGRIIQKLAFIFW